MVTAIKERWACGRVALSGLMALVMAVGCMAAPILAGHSIRQAPTARIILKAIEVRDTTTSKDSSAGNSIEGESNKTGNDDAHSIVHSFQKVTHALVVPSLAATSFLILCVGLMLVFGSIGGKHGQAFTSFKWLIIGAILLASAVPIAN